MLAVPPVDTVYHCKVCPVVGVAVNAVAVAPWQKLIVAVAVGAAGVSTVIDLVAVWVHPFKLNV